MGLTSIRRLYTPEVILILTYFFVHFNSTTDYNLISTLPTELGLLKNLRAIKMSAFKIYFRNDLQLLRMVHKTLTTDIAFNESFVPFFLIKVRKGHFLDIFVKVCFDFPVREIVAKLYQEMPKTSRSHTLFVHWSQSPKGPISRFFKLFQAAKCKTV